MDRRFDKNPPSLAELDKMYGELYTKVENTILDLMEILDEIATAWAKVHGIKAGEFKRPNWNELLKMRRQQKGTLKESRGERDSNEP